MTYRILAMLVALGVLVQAAVIAWAFFGFAKWIDEGNTFTQEMMECEDCAWNFTEERGFMIHGLSGSLIIPVIALLLAIISFFMRSRALLLWGVITFVLVVIQSQVLPALGHSYPVFGALHGLNALLVFIAALIAWRKAGAPAPVPAEPEGATGRPTPPG
ncbi:hypothetical protein [Myceligenerans indicum]|uniref:Uncharacterized protein n=1 Tax=Myceligenerans indicum TaxID=2593663 RepID=A0ABS1LNZ3_9MICO|nr:hypothetical protein [Myceligenerans indicum]MBL0887971.1 hypothetical protein [Myceligenerans indicum]